MRIAVFGSPSFAIPTLEALHEHHDVVLVVSQPDKPAGRGNKLTSPALVVRAKELEIDIAQPAKLRKNEAFAEQLRELELDVCVTAAYGKILPKNILDIPTHGFLNVHGSLLPKYRGAAPIQWALIDGEEKTGVTIMQTDVGMDTGDIRLVRELPITEQDTALTIFTKLSTLGADAMLEALALLDRGELPFIPQDEALATHARMLEKEDGRIRWSDSAQKIFNRYQGVYAWPTSFTSFNSKDIKVKAMSLNNSGNDNEANLDNIGEILAIDDDGIQVQTAKCIINLEEVQPSGKKAMSGKDWANGYQIKVGMAFS